MNLDQYEPMPSDAVFDVEILCDPAVRADKEIQMALQFWVNGVCTLERVALSVMRHLAVERRLLKAKIQALEEEVRKRRRG